VFEKKEHQNSATLGKDTINNWIIPSLSVGKRFSFNNGAQPDVYFLDVTCIGILFIRVYLQVPQKKFKQVYF